MEVSRGGVPFWMRRRHCGPAVAERARFVGGMRHDVRVQAQPFTHLGVPHAEHYRRLLRVFARAKERFIVHLRPEDVAEAVRYVAIQPKHVSIPELIIKPVSQMYV